MYQEATLSENAGLLSPLLELRSIFDFVSSICEWLHCSEIFYISPWCKSSQNTLGLSYRIILRGDFTLSTAALLLLTMYENQELCNNDVRKTPHGHIYQPSASCNARLNKMHTLNGTTSSLPIAKRIENNGSLSNRLLEALFFFFPKVYMG